MSENKKTEKTNKEHLAKINKIDTNRALLRRRRTWRSYSCESYFSRAETEKRRK